MEIPAGRVFVKIYENVPRAYGSKVATARACGSKVETVRMHIQF